MRALRITIGKLFAVALLTLCVGVQALEASGRWDRTFQDSGDEAVLVTVALCIGAALLAADAIRRRLSPTAIPSAIAARLLDTAGSVRTSSGRCGPQHKPSPQSADLASTRTERCTVADVSL